MRFVKFIKNQVGVTKSRKEPRPLGHEKVMTGGLEIMLFTVEGALALNYRHVLFRAGVVLSCVRIPKGQSLQ